MKKPAQIIRTTLGEYLQSTEPYNGPGIYVIACYPALGCLYIGLARRMNERIRQHFSVEPGESDKPLDLFVKRNILDSVKWRMDILVPPVADLEWLIQAERNLIAYFRPTFNVQNNV